ncbi:MAG: polysaccharide biosynthesis/export family protein, partial [Cyanobacteria bacterium J06649_4]
MVAISAPAFLFLTTSALANGLPKPAEQEATTQNATTQDATAESTVEADADSTVDSTAALRERVSAEPRLPALRPLSTPSTAQSNPSFPPATINRQRLPLSPGDRLRVFIPGLGGEEFSGEYEVNFNGELDVPFLEPIPVTGLTAADVQDRLTEVLLEQQFFRPGLLKVSVQILDYSPIQVSVSGEVFDPGRILLSQETAVIGDGGGQVVELPGDNPLERYLTSALKAIGGIKPTADISNVQVLRGTQSVVVDLSGIFSGSAVNDFPLVAG